MQITDIRIRHVAAEGKLRAYVTVTFDDCFVVHNVKIIEGKTGIFIAMPSRKTKTGEYKDVAHPIHSGFRNELQQQILAAFRASDPPDSAAAGDRFGQQEERSAAEGRFGQQEERSAADGGRLGQQDDRSTAEPGEPDSVVAKAVEE